MKYSHINQVTENEIRKLIEAKVPEDMCLEYKKEVKFSNDAEKKELLADVCSFANSEGGVIIYGIEETKDESGKNSGLPSQIINLKINADEVIRSLEESIRKSIEPALIGLNIVSRKIDGKIILILFIPKSSNLPHRVKFKGINKFWKRANANRYEIPIEELREDFLGGAELSKRISEFRSERVTKILSNDIPIVLHKYPKLVLHIIPTHFFDSSQSFENFNQHDISKYQPISTLEGDCSLDYRLNFGGYVVYDLISGNESSFSYTQLFRNFVVEAVDTYTNVVNVKDGKFLTPQNYEKCIIKVLNLYCFSLVQKSISGPCVVFLSMLGIKGYKIYSDSPFIQNKVSSIDRENLLLPDMYIEDISNFSAPKTMKPAFDMIWNACGYSGSRNYDKDGQWVKS